MTETRGYLDCSCVDALATSTRMKVRRSLISESVVEGVSHAFSTRKNCSYRLKRQSTHGSAIHFEFIYDNRQVRRVKHETSDSCFITCPSTDNVVTRLENPKFQIALNFS